VTTDGEPYLRLAQVQIDRLIQGRTRLFALGLIGLDLIYALTHGDRLDLPPQPLVTGFMALSFLALVALALWLSRPRPLAWVNAWGGLATLLAVAGTLTQLHLEGNLRETTHLMLVVVGAGCFLHSLPWLSLNLGVALAGWSLWAWVHRPPGSVTFGVDLLGAAVLGLLLHVVCRELLVMVRDLLVRDGRQVDEQQRTLEELQRAMDSIQTLRGLVPICSSCKKIRDDRGFWHQVEAYVHDHTQATFTHGLCPGCADALRAEFESVTKSRPSPP
jgi:hypothetical protein